METFFINFSYNSKRDTTDFTKTFALPSSAKTYIQYNALSARLDEDEYSNGMMMG